MTTTLRYMRLADIPQVVTIDRLAFTTPWSARSYNYEVSESTYSYMVVLERNEERPLQGIKRLVRSLNGGATEESRSIILGYGGLWNIMDEAHISTIATAPDQRGKGYGELLLAAMIQRSIRLKAAYIVLEVRVSNEVAQKLYRKYGFKVNNTKENYYRDDSEDAYDMRLDLQDQHLVAQAQSLCKIAFARHNPIDLYTEVGKQNKQSDD